MSALSQEEQLTLLKLKIKKMYPTLHRKQQKEFDQIFDLLARLEQTESQHIMQVLYAAFGNLVKEQVDDITSSWCMNR